MHFFQEIPLNLTALVLLAIVPTAHFLERHTMLQHLSDAIIKSVVHVLVPNGAGEITVQLIQIVNQSMEEQ